MLQSYSLNVDVLADSIVPFNNVVVDKACAIIQSGAGAFNINRCGIYNVHVDGVSSASTTIQLYQNGVAVPQAQSTGTTFSFDTLVQVDKNNCRCDMCSSPVMLQVHNSTAATLPNINIIIQKVA